MYFLKFDDQSNFHSLFSMEWYVLGNEWDYSAVNPDSEGANQPQASSNVPGGIFGLGTAATSTARVQATCLSQICPKSQPQLRCRLVQRSHQR